jgi:hypothetical protein
MTNFVNGFEKTAAKAQAASKAMDTAKKILHGGKDVAVAFGKGVKSSGGHTVSDVLKLKGLYSTPAEAIKRSGGIHKALTTVQGRKALSEAAGKVLPQAVAAGAYGAGAKKLYDATLGSDNQSAASMGYYQ